jgi:hypothetical protein
MITSPQIYIRRSLIRSTNQSASDYLLTRQPLPELSSPLLAWSETCHSCSSLGPSVNMLTYASLPLVLGLYVAL